MCFYFRKLDELNKLTKEYRGEKDFHKGNIPVEDRDRLLIKLLAEERNCWIAGSCVFLWIGVHRYRSLLKKYLKADAEKEQAQKLLLDFQKARVPVAAIPAESIQSRGSIGTEEMENPPPTNPIKKRNE